MFKELLICLFVILIVSIYFIEKFQSSKLSYSGNTTCHDLNQNECLTVPGCAWKDNKCQVMTTWYRPYQSNINIYEYRYWQPYEYYNRGYHWPRFQMYPYRWQTFGIGRK